MVNLVPTHVETILDRLGAASRVRREREGAGGGEGWRAGAGGGEGWLAGACGAGGALRESGCPRGPERGRRRAGAAATARREPLSRCCCGCCEPLLRCCCGCCEPLLRCCESLLRCCCG